MTIPHADPNGPAARAYRNVRELLGLTWCVCLPVGAGGAGTLYPNADPPYSTIQHAEHCPISPGETTREDIV